MNNYKNILSSLKVSPVEAEASAGIYFLGIGGIGMSALARYFKSICVKVSGYDKTPTPLTQQLMAEGINIHFEDSTELIDKSVQLVVYTPAVPQNHKELNFFV